jgi:hypothetical protein
VNLPDHSLSYSPPSVLLDSLLLLKVDASGRFVDRLVEPGTNNVHVSGRRGDVAIGRTREWRRYVAGCRWVTIWWRR